MEIHTVRPYSFLFLASALLFISCGASRQTAVADDTHNIGITKVSKRSSSGSINTVERDAVMDNTTTSVIDMLRRVPGVDIGGGNSITIRGVNSMTLSNEPLFVVDGVPVGTGYQSVSAMNANEINRISVLKGPSAGIYGSQGANGVIVIETKGAIAERKRKN